MINQLSVADQLRSARQRAGLTQLELAERLGIGRRAKKRQRSGRR
jgi:transcriptional regulator with XRE-family HTH domain